MSGGTGQSATVAGCCRLTLTGVSGASWLCSVGLSSPGRPVRACSLSHGRGARGSSSAQPNLHLLTSHCQKQVIWWNHMLSVKGWDSCPPTVGRTLQNCVVQGADAQMGCGPEANAASYYRALCVHLSQLPRLCGGVTFLKFLNSVIAF